MSSVLHKFNVKLTDKQFAHIRKEWASHGKTGCALICQPVGVNDPLPLAEPYFNFGILTKECSREVCEVLQKHDARANQTEGK